MSASSQPFATTGVDTHFQSHKPSALHQQRRKTVNHLRRAATIAAAVLSCVTALARDRPRRLRGAPRPARRRPRRFDPPSHRPPHRHMGDRPHRSSRRHRHRRGHRHAGSLAVPLGAAPSGRLTPTAHPMASAPRPATGRTGRSHHSRPASRLSAEPLVALPTGLIQQTMTHDGPIKSPTRPPRTPSRKEPLDDVHASWDDRDSPAPAQAPTLPRRSTLATNPPLTNRDRRPRRRRWAKRPRPQVPVLAPMTSAG